MKKELKEIAFALWVGSLVGGAVYFIPIANEYLTKHISDWLLSIIYATLVITGVVYFLRKL